MVVQQDPASMRRALGNLCSHILPETFVGAVILYLGHYDADPERRRVSSAQQQHGVGMALDPSDEYEYS